MVIFESLLHLTIASALALVSGYGFSDFFTKRGLQLQKIVLAPVFGFLWIIAAVPIVSAITTLSFVAVVRIILAVGCATTVTAIAKNYRKLGWHQYLVETKNQLRQVPIFPTLISLTTFQLSSLLIGYKKFWGTANPDFLQSWSFLDSLNKYSLNFYQITGISNETNLFSFAFPDQFQARFGGVAFSGALQTIGIADGKTALTATIAAGFFVLLLTTSVYFKQLFDKVVTQRVALYTFCCGAPLGMSFIFMFIGQNSTLFLFPLILIFTKFYIDENLTDKKSVFVISLILFASLIIYIPITPVLLAICGLTILIHLLKNPNKIQRFFIDALKVLLVLVGLIMVTFDVSMAILKGYFALIGILDISDTNVIYFNEWHSVTAFPYFLGISTSPITNSYLLLNPFFAYILIWFAVLVAILIVGSLLINSFLRIKTDTTVLASTIVSLGLVFYYAAILEYGYAEFKLSIWFYFLIPIGLAGIVQLAIQYLHSSHARYFFFSVVALVFTFNIYNSIEYSIKGAGRDMQRGTIVNSYGLSSSYESMRDLKSFISKNEKVNEIALALPFIENQIVSAELRGLSNKITLLSHDSLPLDDKYMVGFDGSYVDLGGVKRYPFEGFRTSLKPSWVVVPGKKNPNLDILVQRGLKNPVFSTPYYDLYRAEEFKNYFVTGRGFGRVEYVPGSANVPAEYIRWTYNGFNLLSYSYKQLSSPNKLSVDLEFDSRIKKSHIVEVFLNDKLFETFKVYGSSKITVELGKFRLGVNSVDFRWNPIGCQFDARNLPGIRWCNYAKVKNISIGSQNTFEIPKNVKLFTSDFIEKATTYRGFRTDGWILDDFKMAFEIDKSVSSCNVFLQRDGSNPLLVKKPRIVFGLDGQLQNYFDVPLGNSSFEFKVEKVREVGAYSLKLNYPQGSIDSSNPELQIPMGSVRFGHMICK